MNKVPKRTIIRLFKENTEYELSNDVIEEIRNIVSEFIKDVAVECNGEIEEINHLSQCEFRKQRIDLCVYLKILGRVDKLISSFNIVNEEKPIVKLVYNRQVK